jgi:hypothetical protein
MVSQAMNRKSSVPPTVRTRRSRLRASVDIGGA